MAAVKDVTIRINVDDGDVKKTTKDFDKLNSTVTKGSKQMTTSLGSMNKSLLSVGAALGGAFAVKAVISNAIKSIVAFDKAMASLSAITGVVGKDLENLKGLVFEVAKETKKSSIEIAAAFELVGSKAPKLLENADALAAVTKEAITLNKATGGELIDSVSALTGVMNQFNLGAEDSNRIINALAAGSQKGAAPVAQISQAIDKFGTVANAANVSVEASIGLVETLAEKNINGAEAGTQLRNIILKLQAANIGFTDGVFNLNDGLQEVADRNLSAAESAKLFGLESVTAANILTVNIDKLDTYTTAVTGTNTAMEQAAINSDTLAIKTEELGAQWENFIISMDDSSSVIGGTSKALLDFFSEALTGAENLDLIWKTTFSGLGEFTEKELQRSLNGGLFVTEFGVSLSKITKEFDKIPFDQLTGNVDKVKESWVELLGDDRQEDVLLFNQYLRDRIEAEKGVKKSTEGITEAVEELETVESETVEKRLSRLKKESAARIALRKALVADSIESDAGDEAAEDEFLKEFGLSDDQLALMEEQQAIQKELREEDAQSKIDDNIELQEAMLDFDRRIAESRKALDAEIIDSSILLAGALLNAVGASAEAQAAFLVFQKGIEVARIVSTTAAANQIITAEGLALAIPSGGASVATAAGLVASNNVSAGLNIATIAATAIPQISGILKPKKLKDGEVLISGDGTETSDSIPAMLSVNESIINAKSSKKHTAALKAINNDNFDEYLNRIVLQRMFTGQRDVKKESSISNQRDVSFPDRMNISNARAISKPIVEAMEENAFLNQNGSWQ